MKSRMLVPPNFQPLDITHESKPDFSCNFALVFNNFKYLLVAYFSSKFFYCSNFLFLTFLLLVICI